MSGSLIVMIYGERRVMAPRPASYQVREVTIIFRSQCSIFLNRGYCTNYISLQGAIEVAVNAFPGLNPSALTLATDELPLLDGKMTEILANAWDEVSDSISRVTILHGQAPRALAPSMQSTVHKRETVQVRIRFAAAFQLSCWVC